MDFPKEPGLTFIPLGVLHVMPCHRRKTIGVFTESRLIPKQQDPHTAPLLLTDVI